MKNRRRFDVDQPDEVCGDAADVRVCQNGVESLELVGGGEHRASHQPFEIRALGDQRVESRQCFGDGVGLALVMGEREQGGRVASRNSRNDRVVLCQAPHLVAGLPKPTRSAPKRRQPQEFPMFPGLEFERADWLGPKGAGCLT